MGQGTDPVTANPLPVKIRTPLVVLALAVVISLVVGSLVGAVPLAAGGPGDQPDSPQRCAKNPEKKGCPSPSPSDSTSPSPTDSPSPSATPLPDSDTRIGFGTRRITPVGDTAE